MQICIYIYIHIHIYIYICTYLVIYIYICSTRPQRHVTRRGLAGDPGRKLLGAEDISACPSSRSPPSLMKLVQSRSHGDLVGVPIWETRLNDHNKNHHGKFQDDKNNNLNNKNEPNVAYFKKDHPKQYGDCYYDLKHLAQSRGIGLLGPMLP